MPGMPIRSTSIRGANRSPAPRLHPVSHSALGRSFPVFAPTPRTGCDLDCLVGFSPSVRNAAGPGEPCSMKPYPTIRRSGTGAQRAIGDLLIRSMGRSRQFGDRLWI